MLLNVAAIVGLRWISTAAALGPSSLTLWVLGLITFFIPSALAVIELSSRLPGEGGFYLWTKAAFGDMHGFIAGWSYWMSNLVFFPSLLLFGAGVALYIGGGSWLGLAENAQYNATYSVIVLWFAIGLNVLGLQRAKWLQNVGGIANWLAGLLVLVTGVIAWWRFGSATQITTQSLVPDLTSLATLTSFAFIALAYDGLELGPILGDEIRDTKRAVARAALIAGIVITAVYLLGTASVLAALPPEHISMISGIPQALAAVGERVGFPAFGSITAALLTVAQIGALGAWIAGTARLPFVFGIDRYMPNQLGAVHPKFASPYVALLVQGVLATLVLFAALSGSAIHEAFVMLINMTVILTFVPLLYLFAALPVLRWRAAGKNDGVRLIPGGPIVCGVVSASGLAITLLAVIVSLVPPADSSSRALFLLKVVGGCAVMIVVGLGFYLRRKRISAAIGGPTTGARLRANQE